MRLSEDSKDNWPTHRGFGGLDWASQKHNVVIVDSAGLSKGYTRLSSSHRIATQETHHMSRRVPASNRSGRHPDEAAHAEDNCVAAGHAQKDRKSQRTLRENLIARHSHMPAKRLSGNG